MIEMIVKQYEKGIITLDEAIAKLMDLKSKASDWEPIAKANGLLEAIEVLKEAAFEILKKE